MCRNACSQCLEKQRGEINRSIVEPEGDEVSYPVGKFLLIGNKGGPTEQKFGRSRNFCTRAKRKFSLLEGRAPVTPFAALGFFPKFLFLS